MALSREPVYVATTVGPGRAPPGRRTRAGRRDGGWAHSAPPWGRWCPVDNVQRRPRRQPRRWHDEVVTERAVLQGGYQRGETFISPLWNEIIDLFPPPVRKGIRLWLTFFTGGGRGWAPQSLSIRQARPGGWHRGHAHRRGQKKRDHRQGDDRESGAASRCWWGQQDSNL